MSEPTIFTALSSVPDGQFMETVPEGNPTAIGFIHKDGEKITVSVVTEYTNNCAPCNNICAPPLSTPAPTDPPVPTDPPAP